MIHEALPPGRPLQEVIGASLDVGAGERRARAGAEHRHPHGHPRMARVRLGVDWGGLIGSRAALWHVSAGRKGVVERGCAKRVQQLHISSSCAPDAALTGVRSRHLSPPAALLSLRQLFRSLFPPPSLTPNFSGQTLARARSPQAARILAPGAQSALLMLGITSPESCHLTLRLSGLLGNDPPQPLSEHLSACRNVCGRPGAALHTTTSCERHFVSEQSAADEPRPEPGRKNKPQIE